MTQLNLFIKSDSPCECTEIIHPLTEFEFQDCLNKVNKIKQLIVNNGFELSFNYFSYLNKLKPNCSAWKETNTDYLVMRADFHKELEDATIPLYNGHFY